MTSDVDRELSHAAAPPIEGELGVVPPIEKIEASTSEAFRFIELLSAYFLTGSKVLAVAAISAMLWRETSNNAIAVFVIVRSLLNLVSYAFAGASPTMVRHVTAARTQVVIAHAYTNRHVDESSVLSYASRSTITDSPEFIAYARLRNGFGILAILLLILTPFAPMLLWVSPVEVTSHYIADFVWLMTLGQIVRGFSEVWSGRLIARGLLAPDNLIAGLADLIWAFPLAFTVAKPWGNSNEILAQVGVMYLISAVALGTVRGIWVATFLKSRTTGITANPLPALKPAFAISLAMLSDFLYAPATYFIVGHFLLAAALADYAPAVQVDTALVLLVSGFATLALPKSATASGARHRGTLEKLFIRGTLASATMLAIAACGVILLRRPLIDAWLGSGNTGTIAILPLVLIHTVLGGASGVMRSILLGIGEAKAYTLAALAGGILNITLGYTLAVPLGLGLKGIVLGTIIAVGLRCAVWMPWYTARAIKRV